MTQILLFNSNQIHGHKRVEGGTEILETGNLGKQLCGENVIKLDRKNKHKF